MFSKDKPFGFRVLETDFKTLFRVQFLFGFTIKNQLVERWCEIVCVVFFDLVIQNCLLFTSRSS